MIEFFRGYELDFAIDILLSLAAGFIIGAERESRGKAAGISTNCFVIGGSMIFTYLSAAIDPTSTSRIAAQLVSGIGFLGAGRILKGVVVEGFHHWMSYMMQMGPQGWKGIVLIMLIGYFLGMPYSKLVWSNINSD